MTSARNVLEDQPMRKGISLRGALSLLALVGLAACGAASAERHDAPSAELAAAVRGGLSEARLAEVAAGIGQAGPLLARRFDPLPHADDWDRSAAWARLDLGKAPLLPFQASDPKDAQALNALLPALAGRVTPSQPFFLPVAGKERERAVLCLTQAIYYEAALEPLAGQQAVAQTVLNRVRHPDFPKSICGVVYQGASQPLTCDFTFACDGSLQRPPIEPYWGEARAVAEQALAGHVDGAVGPALYYHATYVFPRWGSWMVKIGQVGTHIFYQFPGPMGRADALSARYLGGETKVSLKGPSLAAIAAARAAAGEASAKPSAPAGPPPPTSPTDLRPRVAGQIVFGRRVASREEIQSIDADIARLAGETQKAPPAASDPANALP
jgi:spore germination cell wall hydrolase CwlJ-like protein